MAQKCLDTKVEECKIKVYRAHVYTEIILGGEKKFRGIEGVKFNLPLHLNLKKGDRIKFFYDDDLYGKNLHSFVRNRYIKGGNYITHNYIRAELYRKKDLLAEIKGTDMQILEAVRKAQNKML